MTRSEATFWFLNAGEDYRPTWGMLEELLPHFEGVQYEFMDPVEYERMLHRDIPGAMRIYWREMLYRAHWAAAASLMRTHRWMLGVLDAFASENHIVFCACARGLLESSADSGHSLSGVPLTLASSKKQIERALAGQSKQPTVAKELEDRLLHFNFARKKGPGENIPATHIAESPANYLRFFEGEQPSIRQFYAKLCEVVHPAASSVLTFSRPLDQTASKVVFTLEEEARSLAYMAAALRTTLPDIVGAGVNLGLLILRTLNAFPLIELHTRYLDMLTFERNRAWETIEPLIRAE